MLAKLQNLFHYGSTNNNDKPLFPGRDGIPSCSNPDLKGSTVSFHNLHYIVAVKDPNKLCGKIPKEILTSANGMFKPGLNAIMGAGGSGKTTLLDALAGRKDTRSLMGYVLIDGKMQPSNFTSIAGYVGQSDVLVGTLTVRESLEFSANLRLPKTVSKKDKRKRVTEILFDLGLENCANTKVGNEFVEGISEGEKKKTSVGMELIISPPVLFLDEPTRGLDPDTANSLVRYLYHLSQTGSTVVLATQQPRYAIFRLLDRLTLLGQGRTVFHGPAKEAILFFQSMGYECERFNNPADFFIDVMHGDYGEHSSEGVVLTRYYSDEIRPMSEEPTDPHARKRELEVLEMQSKTRKTLFRRLAEKYNSSKWFMEEKEELDKSLEIYHSDKSSTFGDPVQCASSWTKFCAITKRGFLNMLRSPHALYMQVGVLAALAVILGILYFQVDRKYPSGVQNRAGAFVFVLMICVFINVIALDVFFRERKVLMHELSGGFYTVTSAFLSKIISDFISMRSLSTGVCSIITYFMIGFVQEPGHFFLYFLTLFLASLTITSMAYCISAFCSRQDVAKVATVLLTVLQALFGGHFINIRDIPSCLSWIQYLSVFRYSLKALHINEFKDMEFCETDGVKQCYPDAGNDYLRAQKISYTTKWDLWQNIFAMSLLTVIFLIVSYLRMRRLKTNM